MICYKEKWPKVAKVIDIIVKTEVEMNPHITKNKCVSRGKRLVESTAWLYNLP